MSKLTKKQRDSIPVLASPGTITELCEQAGITRPCYYKWMGDEDFVEALEAERRRVSEEAFAMLESNLTKAVKVLAELLDTADTRLRRLTALDVIKFHFEHKCLESIEQRLEALEQALD